MSSEMDLEMTETLGHMQRVESLIDEQVHRLDTEFFRGTDEAKTVGVTLNGLQCLTGLYIEDGLLRLGAETVAQRINEAVRNAQAIATAANEAQQQRFIESMAAIVGPLSEAFGATEAKPE